MLCADKVFNNSDIGDIFFKVNSDAINWAVPLNKNQKNRMAVNDLMTHILQGWNVEDIEIIGWASPEGSMSYNKNLSDKRAKMTENFMKNRLSSFTRDTAINIAVMKM